MGYRDVAGYSKLLFFTTSKHLVTFCMYYLVFCFAYFRFSTRSLANCTYNHCQNYLENLTFCAVLFYFLFVFLNTTTSAPLSHQNNVESIEKYQTIHKKSVLHSPFLFSIVNQLVPRGRGGWLNLHLKIYVSVPRLLAVIVPLKEDSFMIVLIKSKFYLFTPRGLYLVSLRLFKRPVLIFQFDRIHIKQC